jgi:hypothetical protein
MSSTWDCERHGPVAPLRTYPKLHGELITQLAAKSRVPVWCPLPAPAGLDGDGDGARR